MMYGDDIGAISSHGEITVPFTQFPAAILQKMIDNKGLIPVLKISLSRVLLPNGLDLNNDDGAMVVKFDFEAFAIEVEEQS